MEGRYKTSTKSQCEIWKRTLIKKPFIVYMAKMPAACKYPRFQTTHYVKIKISWEYNNNTYG